MIYVQSLDGSIHLVDYLEQRLGKLLSSVPEDERRAMIASLSRSSEDGVICHFQPADGPAGLEGTLSTISDDLSTQIPPGFDEQILEEELCVPELSEGDSQSKPLVLRQTTNHAVVLIAVPFQLAGKEIVPFPSSPEGEALPPVEEAPQNAAAASALALALAKKLGLALLSQVGSAVWDAVKKQVLGPTPLPDYYTQVYQELRRIVASEFQRHYVEEVEKLTDLFEKKVSYYNNMGRKEADFTLLKTTSHDLLVRSNRLGNPGAFHYGEACVLYLMMMQEDYKRMKEAGESRETLDKAKAYISKNARQYAANLKTKRDALHKQRMQYIGTDVYQFYGSKMWIPGRRIGGVHEGGYAHDGKRYVSPNPTWGVQNMFKDDGNEFWLNCQWVFWKPGFSWHFVNDRLQAYRGHIDRATTNDLAPLLETAATVLKIADKPVAD